MEPLNSLSLKKNSAAKKNLSPSHNRQLTSSLQKEVLILETPITSMQMDLLLHPQLSAILLILSAITALTIIVQITL